MKFNKKYTAIIVIGFLVTFFTSGLIVKNYTDLRDSLVASEQEQLETIAKNAAKSMEIFVQSEKKALEVLVTDEQFNSLNSNQDTENSVLEVYYKVQSPKIKTIELFDNSAYLKYTYPENKSMPVNADDVFQSIEDEKSVVYSGFNSTNGQPSLFISQPFYDDDELSGVVRIELDVDYIYESFIEPVRIHDKGYASVKNQDLIFVMHPQKDQIGKNVIEERVSKYPEFDWVDFIDLMRSQTKGGSGSAIYHSVWVTDDKPTRVKKFNGYSTTEIGDGLWIVTVSSDYNEVTSVIKRNYYSTISLAVGMMVMLLGMIGFMIFSYEEQKKLSIQMKLTNELQKANRTLERDILQRKKLEKDLIRNQRKYKGLFQTGSDCVFVINLEKDNLYQIEEVNDKVVSSLGYEESQLLKMSFVDLSNLSVEEMHEIVGMLEEDGLNRLINTDIKRFDDSRVPVEISSRLVKLEQGMKMIVFARNITERIIAEEAMVRSEMRFLNILQSVSTEIHEGGLTFKKTSIDDKDKLTVASKLESINLELEKMFKKELDKRKEKEALMIDQSRFAAMGEMINNIAHQWRQPLNVLSLIISNFEDQVGSESLDRETLEILIGKSYMIIDKMSQTIDDFRDFLKPTTEDDLFKLREVVQTTYNLCSERLSHHDIKFDVKGELTENVSGRSNQMVQVLLNLINNSVDALIESSNPTKKILVTIDLAADEHEAVIRLSDSGSGIPEEVKRLAFEPYFTTKGENNGTGIGLYMSRMIIEGHFKGNINILNSQKGALIEIRLPLS